MAGVVINDPWASVGIAWQARVMAPLRATMTLGATVSTYYFFFDFNVAAHTISMLEYLHRSRNVHNINAAPRPI